MKITNELHTKITRALDEKYAEVKNAALETYEKAKAEKLPRIASRLEAVFAAHPEAKELLSRGYENPNTITERVYGNSHTILAEDYKIYQNAYTEIQKQRTNDYENLAIEISYQKNINGIKEAFKNAGLSF